MLILLSFALPLCLGALLGFGGGIFGIGGGIIAIPVLVGLFGMDQKLAQGTALVMMVPNLATHQMNAEAWMDFYYEPEIAARLAAMPPVAPYRSRGR